MSSCPQGTRFDARRASLRDSRQKGRSTHVRKLGDAGGFLWTGLRRLLSSPGPRAVGLGSRRVTSTWVVPARRARFGVADPPPLRAAARRGRPTHRKPSPRCPPLPPPPPPPCPRPSASIRNSSGRRPRCTTRSRSPWSAARGNYVYDDSGQTVPGRLRRRADGQRRPRQSESGRRDRRAGEEDQPHVDAVREASRRATWRKSWRRCRRAICPRRSSPAAGPRRTRRP